MTVYRVAFVIFTIVTSSTETPFILDQSLTICNYSSNQSNSRHIHTTSEILSAKFDPLQINFRLCGKFSERDGCPMGAVACLINYKTGQKVILGTEFQFDGTSMLKSISGNKCTKNERYSLVVDLQRYQINPSYVFTEGNCTYHVKMMDPSFTPPCAVRVLGQILDLSPLSGRFSSQIDGKNFSVALCGSNSGCGDDINACEITEGAVIPISMQSSVHVIYSGDKNQLSFHGFKQNTSTSKIDKRFEVFLKCDWDKKEIRKDDLKYIKKPTQGKKYTFELETSYGCIKKPMPCTVQDGFWVYDLSKLYDSKQMWSTRGTPYRNDSVYFLQMCSRGEPTLKNTVCKNSYAQVCERVNGEDINRGSVLSGLSVTNDGLRATINSGTKCEENKSHTTLIDFKCDKEEQGPKLLKQDKCETLFQWRTPEACPKQNASSCSYIPAELNNCTFYANNNHYDLSGLNKTKIIVGDEKDRDLQFLLNICKPILDEEIPCTKDLSVARKNLSEPNIKNRIVSLGKFAGGSVRSNSFVMEYTTGAYCDDGFDYTSDIRLECSEDEEDPIISLHNKCYYEFLWKTKHACPRPVNKNALKNLDDQTNCAFVDHLTDKSIDFGHLIPIEFDGNTSSSIFHICNRLYFNCTVGQDECIRVPFKNQTVAISKNSTTLKVYLSKTCTSPKEYNKVVLNFICDQVKNNDHLGSVTNKGCELVVDYLSNVVCSPQDNSQEVSEQLELKTQLLPKKNLLKEVVGCSIKSPFTHQELNIHNLTNDFFKKNCPAASFNDTFQFVKLHYTTEDRCRPVPTKNISYEVYLMCRKDESLSFQNEDCLQLYNYQRPEYCSFFATPRNSQKIIAGVLGSILLIGLLAVGIVLWKRRPVCVKENGFISLYEKNTEI